MDPYQPNAFPPQAGIAPAEVVREAATLVMLLAVGGLAGRSWRSRLGYALVAFGVWDIFYYVFLKIITGWPHSLLDWDILFLIPLPWWGPVMAPVSIALVMLGVGHDGHPGGNHRTTAAFRPDRVEPRRARHCPGPRGLYGGRACAGCAPAKASGNCGTPCSPRFTGHCSCWPGCCWPRPCWTWPSNGGATGEVPEGCSATTTSQSLNHVMQAASTTAEVPDLPSRDKRRIFGRWSCSVPAWGWACSPTSCCAPARGA